MNTGEPRRDANATTARDVGELRAQMPVARHWAYFDHAAVCPLPEPARAAIAAWADDVAANGTAHWLRYAAQLDGVRRRGAELIGAEPDEIALVRNTTEGINLVAEGFPWRAGDNVVTPADEFPSNQYPWMHLADHGVETRRVPVAGGRVDPSAVEAACDSRTRLIAVSWVGYASGWRNDLDAFIEIARRRGAYLFVDAIQALGVFPLDVQKTPVDFLAADGHKWLLGAEGAGLFYMRREHLDLLRPVGVGWNSVANTDFSRIELKFKPSAARYEGGTYPMGLLAGLGASLDLLASFPRHAIAARVLEVSELAVERLRAVGAIVHSAREPERASGIISFGLPGRDPVVLRKRCLERGVVLSCRAGRLRISPHAYNDASDVDRLINGLQ